MKLHMGIPQDLLSLWDRWDYAISGPETLEDEFEVRVILINEDGTSIDVVLDVTRQLSTEDITIEPRNPAHKLSPFRHLLDSEGEGERTCDA